MEDKIEQLQESTIHHGKFNDRIYLMKLAPHNIPEIIPELDKLAKENGYTKIFAKIQPEALPHFISGRYSIEAFVPKFYKNNTDCLFVSKFNQKSRCQVSKNELDDFYRLLNSTEKSKRPIFKHSRKYLLEELGHEDVEQITEIFKRVFKTYPFPVHNPRYIRKTMRGDKTQYFGVKDGGRLIGVSTAEIDLVNKNAEMTDFAVLPEYRGQNLAFRLLVKMEQEMKYSNIKTVYTIARLNEPGMSKTFLKSGFKYSGTLINNTNIGGSIESMNIFYKHL